MTTALEALIPTRWFRKDEGDWPMSDEVIVPPPIARLPMPEQTDEEQRLKVIADAHVFVAQLGHERTQYRQTIERLENEKADIESKLKCEIRRAELAELELSQVLNDMQTKEADFAEKERCLSLLQQVLDKFGTKAPPKPERKPRPKKKADRESTTETLKADG